jgi:hypothetical protein
MDYEKQAELQHHLIKLSLRHELVSERLEAALEARRVGKVRGRFPKVLTVLIDSEYDLRTWIHRVRYELGALVKDL